MIPFPRLLKSGLLWALLLLLLGLAFAVPSVWP